MGDFDAGSVGNMSSSINNIFLFGDNNNMNHTIKRALHRILI